MAQLTWEQHKHRCAVVFTSSQESQLHKPYCGHEAPIHPKPSHLGLSNGEHKDKYDS